MLVCQRFLLVATLVSTCANFAQTGARAGQQDLAELASLSKSRSIYQRSLDEVAEAQSEFGDQATAHAIRALFVPPRRGKQRVFLPPGMQAGSDIEHRLQAAELRSDLRAARRAYAEQLWAHAELALSSSHRPERVTIAYQLVHEAAFVDPTHPKAKHLVEAGHASNRDGKAKPAKSRHKEYGWPAGSYWRIKTDHFLIVTNHSAAAASKAAVELEETYNVWRQMFAQLWLSPESLRRAMDGALLPLNRRHHKVVLFADRAEYIRRLKSLEPHVAVSTGMYRDVVSSSFFYLNDPLRTDTWRHELTHQLFQEILRAEPGVAADSNFWAVEAVALYMESAQRRSGYYELGGVDARRLQFARYRALNEQFYVPIDELKVMSKRQLQEHPDIRKLYSQAAGLAHFLFDYGTKTRNEVGLNSASSAKYRSAFIEHLGDLYRLGRRARPLAEIADASPGKLDFDYHEYLKIGDRDLASLSDSAQGNFPVRSLCLGHTKITNAGLSCVAQLDKLEWLDLTGCQITDEGLLSLADSYPLKRLSLEGTSITDLSCGRLATFVQLEELDLSHTKVTDAGLKTLVSLKNLKSLWLSGTDVTDQVVQTLLQLRQLEHLNISGTSVSPDAWEELKAALPH